MSGASIPVSPPTDSPSCEAPSRFWVIPSAVVTVVVAVAAGLLLLAWAGVIPPPPFVGPNPQYWFLFPLGFALFWLFILGVVRLWSWRSAGRWGWASAPDAEGVVRLRFARGEISMNEMEQMLRDLAEHAAPKQGGWL